MRALKQVLLVAALLAALPGVGQAFPPLRIYNQGNSTPDSIAFKLRMTGTGVSCASSGGFETCTINGASPTGYQTIDSAAVALTQRTVVNFDGTYITCVDNAGATRTDCTLATTLGGLTLTSPTFTGTVTSASLTAPAATALTLTSNLANGATPGMTFIDVGAFDSGNPAFSWYTNTNKLVMQLMPQGSGGPYLQFYNTSGTFVSGFRFLTTGVQMASSSQNFISGGGTSYVGTNGGAWGGMWSDFYSGVNQNLTWSTSTPAAVNIASGNFATATLSANVTSWSIAAPPTGFYGLLTMVFVQSAGGNTLAGAASNIKLNGTLTLSASASKRDTVVFMYDGTNWIEVTRSLNN